MRILSESEKKSFEEHLDECISCQRELALEKTIDAALSESFEPPLLEHAVMERVRLIRSCKPITTPFNLVPALGYALCGLLTGFLGVTLWRFIPFHRILAVRPTIPDIHPPAIPSTIFLVVVGSFGILLTLGSIIFSLHLDR